MAVEVQLEQFYALTGTDEEFFDESLSPNVSSEVFSKWVELRHQRFYQWPNFEYADEYVNLGLRVNELLFTHDFDYCVRYFEKHLAEITEKRSISQFQRAMSDGIQLWQLQQQKQHRGEDNYPVTARDKVAMLEYAKEFLREDHGWDEANINAAFASQKPARKPRRIVSYNLSLHLIPSKPHRNI